VVEQMQCITVWSLKGCLIFLYYRLTYVQIKAKLVIALANINCNSVNLDAHKYVIVLICYVAATFVIMEILYLGVWCRPLSNYWAVPTPNVQCSAATDHLITNAVFNLSSDIAMIVIGFSLFIRSKLPWSRKIILCCIFSLGIFVILAAVLNKYYSFAHPFGSQWTFWYIRESSTAMIVANLPFTWTLLRRMFKLESFNGQGDTQRSVAYHSSRSARGRHIKTSPRHSRTIPKSDVHRGSNKSGSNQDSHNSSIDMKQVSRQQSPPLDMSFADILGPGGKAMPAADGHALPLPKPVKRASFREQGLFGREDLELMLDPWDSGTEGDTPVRLRDSISNYGGRPGAISGGSNRGSVRSTDGSPGSPTGSAGSLGSPKRMSRIRDEEAQYNLQEDVGAKCHYYDGPPDWISEKSVTGSIGEEGGRIVDTPNDGDVNQLPQRPLSAGAERKAPTHDEHERLSRSKERRSSLTL
jgi:hypothetical protein